MKLEEITKCCLARAEESMQLCAEQSKLVMMNYDIILFLSKQKHNIAYTVLINELS